MSPHGTRPVGVALRCHDIMRAGVTRPNGDAMLVGIGADPALFAVADRMGGPGGAASSPAVAVLADLGPDGPLDGTFGWANHEIFDNRRAGGADSAAATIGGASVVALRVPEGGKAAELCHVVNARAYLLRSGTLGRLTENHSLVSVPARPHAAATGRGPVRCDVVAKVLGGCAEVWVDRELVGFRPGDRFVLCSDGLSEFVPDRELRRVLCRAARGPRAAAWAPAAAAARAGSDDDLTVVVIAVAGMARPADPGIPGGR
jgi:serine/threonine protein phosphatase PrpC